MMKHFAYEMVDPDTKAFRRCIRVSPKEGDNVYSIMDPADYSKDVCHTEGRFEDMYVTGEVANTLFAYESLGYTPEQLKQIIQLFPMYRLMSHSTFGATGSKECSGLQYNLREIIDDAMKHGDRSIRISAEGGKSTLDILPFPQAGSKTKKEK